MYLGTVTNIFANIYRNTASLRFRVRVQGFRLGFRVRFSNGVGKFYNKNK